MADVVEIMARAMSEEFTRARHSGTVIDMQAAIRRAIKDAGYAIVPVEPSEAMLKYGMSAFMAAHDRMFAANEPTGPIYKAMIQASQGNDDEVV